jgi:hypothetical protein
MSLGKSELLLPVQPRVFATTNHFQEMLWSPTARALDELELEDSGAGEAELVFSRSHAYVFGLFIFCFTYLISANTCIKGGVIFVFVSVVPSPQAIESFTVNESPLSRGDFEIDFDL